MSDIFNTDPKQLELFNQYMQNQNRVVSQNQPLQNQSISNQPLQNRAIKLERPVKDDFEFSNDLDFGSFDTNIQDDFSYNTDMFVSDSNADLFSNTNADNFTFEPTNLNESEFESTVDLGSDFNINEEDTEIESELEPNGFTGLVLSILMLLMYFCVFAMSKKEQVYSLNISLETFYILAPVAMIANGVAYKSLMGKIGGILFIGVMILQLIQEYAI